MAAHPNNMKKKQQALLCDTNNVKYIIRTVMEFEEVAQPSHLNLKTGPLKFEHFHCCLARSV